MIFIVATRATKCKRENGRAKVPRAKRHGLATLCVGGGQGAAMLVEAG
ncbi:MAG TPA: hypothetical protein VKA46_06600 [Gemmataceae bacterium]|nr:hypothetical protein [Gemmataceae bacterium]